MTHMTAEEQIKAVLKDVVRLNRRKDAVYTALMNQFGELRCPTGELSEAGQPGERRAGGNILTGRSRR